MCSYFCRSRCKDFKINIPMMWGSTAFFVGNSYRRFGDSVFHIPNSVPVDGGIKLLRNVSNTNRRGVTSLFDYCLPIYTA